MNKLFKISLSIVMFFMTIGIVKAEGEVSISVADIEGVPGSQVKLSIDMVNTVDILAYQVFIKLPDGITIATKDDDYDITVLRGVDHSASSNLTNEGIYKIAVASLKNKAFIGTEGSVCELVLNIAEDIAEGEYDILFSGMEFSESAFSKYNPENFVSKVKIVSGVPTYDKGYTIGIKPFSASVSEACTIVLNFDAQDENITDIEFDMEMPSVLTRTKSGRANKAFDSADENRMYVEGTEGDHAITINNGHVTIESIVDDEYMFIAGTSGALVNMYYTVSSSAAEGIYPVKFTNVMLKDGDGNVLNIAPTTSYIKIGNPTKQSLALEGKITADVNEALAQESSNTIESLDLSKVSEIDGTLTLVDYRELVPPSRPVEVSKVSYARKASNAWGTIFLPYAVSSDENIQYYQLKGTNGDVMTFVPVDGLKAGEPGVFKKADGSTVSFDVENTTISNSVKEGQEVEGFKLVGSYRNIAINTAETPGCYIKDNQFKTGVGTFYIDTFRSYFLNSNPNPAKTFKIAVEDEITGITTVVGELDAKTGEIYSINGARLTNAKGIYIKNGKKYFAK